MNRIGVLINLGAALCLLITITPSLLMSADRANYAKRRPGRDKSRIDHSWSYRNDAPAYEASYDSENYGRKAEKKRFIKNTRRRNESYAYNTNYRYNKKRHYRHYKKRKKRELTPAKKRNRVKPKRRKNRKKIIYYKIKRGDTLTKISRKYSIPIKTIIKINRLKNGNRIKSGMIIKLTANKHAGKRKNRRKNKTYPKKKSPAFIWPVKKVISFKRDGLKGVKPIGIIIKGKPGSPVISSAPGIVKKIGRMRGFGKYVIVKHDKRFITVYANLDRITVTRGERINRGERIGKIKRNRSIFHFQIGRAGKPINPLKYLPGRKRHKM